MNKLMMIVCLLAVSMFAGVAAAITEQKPDADDGDVKIGVACGTLKGSGTILIIDKKTERIFRLPFTCPIASI